MESINLILEKSKNLSSEKIFDIVNTAITVSTIDGYINSYIMSRVLLLLICASIYTDKEKNIVNDINNLGVLQTWDIYLESDLIEKLNEEYPDDVSLVSIVANQWVNSYNEYTQSIGNIVNSLDTIMNGITTSLTNNFVNAVDQTGASNVINLADQWGINNNITQELNLTQEEAQKSNSLILE